MKTILKVKTQFVGYHYWKDAPGEVEFLRNSHRHVFHVICYIPVVGLDREKEFFMVRSKVDSFLRKYEGREFQSSCEMIAEDILNNFPDMESVEVTEDGENGAICTRTES